MYVVIVFFSKQKTAYEVRISDWSSDVCSSDLEQVEWWTYGLMGKSDPRPCIGASSSRAFMTEWNDELRAITAPTLVITTEERGLKSVETARADQEKVPNSHLRVLPGQAYHAAVQATQDWATVVTYFIYDAYA